MKRLILTSLCVLFASAVAMGDWDAGDPCKMHYAQLPDPFGWDVTFGNVGYQYPLVLGDDWQCTSTGPVSDIHLWYSWQGDYVGNITGLYVAIFDNVPADGEYSKPGEMLWNREFEEGDFTTRLVGKCAQGWYCPIEGYIEDDHEKMYQINIIDIEEPFKQLKDEIYWLVVYGATWEGGSWPGWKTSKDHWNDCAVYGYPEGWQMLLDPETEDNLDLAFVITPEPTTMVLLGLGSLSLLRSRRRR